MLLSSHIDHLMTQPLWFAVPAYLGLLIAALHLLSFLRWTFATFLRPPKNLASYGPWALVTGPTDGIGKALAFQLASRGLNVILVGRSPDKLRSVSSEIQAKFPDREIRTAVVDFAADDAAEAVGRVVSEAVEGLDVGVVVNNAGVTYPAARYIHEVEEEVWRGVVRVNLEATTRVTMAVLPGMLRRRRGVILNMGSGAGIVVPSHPLFAFYSATKAYVDQLSRSLFVEYGSHGIHFQCQVPLYIATRLVGVRPSLFVPSSDNYAKVALRQIGYEARSMPYWPHALQWWLASLFPDYFLDLWRLSIGIHKRNVAMLPPLPQMKQ